MGNSNLSFLRGNSLYAVNQHIRLKYPTLGEIESYGEQKYWGLVSNLTSTSYDHRFALDDLGIDYEDIDDFTIFMMVVSSLTSDDTGILFGSNINFQNFKPTIKDDGYVVLHNETNGVNIDLIIYELIAKHLRNTHGLKRNYRKSGNKMARHYHMVEERRIWEEEQKKAAENYSSLLAPLVSSMVNCSDFKYNYETVWDLSIYQFMDAVTRISNTVNYRNLMMGIYTGNVDSKSISKKSLNWLGELE